MTLFLLLITALATAEDPPEPKPAAAPLPAPVVQLKAQDGKRFSVIVKGKPSGVAAIGAPVVLSELGPGTHSVEIRTEDNLVIWARGVVELKPGDQIVLMLSEGRPVTANGRTGAWRATAGTPPPPPPKKD